MSDYDSIKYNNTSKDPTILGTDGMVVPKGTTAERIGTTTGKLRYNTDLGFLEQYNATGWAGIDAPPTVSSVTGVINEDVDATITVLGSNFKSGSQVSITGAAVSGIDRPLSTTFINSGELTAASNASSVNFVGGASYNVKVTNPSGLSAVLEPAGTVDQTLAWTTGAGTVKTILDENDVYSPITTLVATDPDGTSVTYAETTSTLSGAGMTLNSNGTITGNPNNVTGQTTVSFTARATSNGISQDRSFNIIVNPTPDGSSSSRPGTNAAQIKSLTGTTTDGLYWVRHAGLNSGNAFQIYADMNLKQGRSWFSPGYFGVEPTSEYQLTNNATYTKLLTTRANSGAYNFWFLIVSKSGTNYTPIYGALLQTASGGSAGDDLTFDLTSDPITTIGSPTIPSSGNYYIAWLSYAPGYTNPSGSMWNDTSGSRGSIEYVASSTAPTTGTTYATTSGATGYRMHFQAQAIYNGAFITTGHPSPHKGGWTLVHSIEGSDGVDWNNTNFQGLNQTAPNLNGGAYSIMSWAPTIRSQNSAYWYYVFSGNNSTNRYEYGAICHAGSGDSFLDSTPRTGSYFREFTFPNSTFQGPADTGDTCYDRVLWTNTGGYGPHPSALLTTYPGTPNWWGTVTEGGQPRGYSTGPYMNSAGMGTPTYKWVWVK